MKESRIKNLFAAPLALLVNLLLVYICFSLCRLLFIWVNHSYFADLTLEHFWEMFCGGFVFDTSAILYTNILYVVLILFPLHYKENPTYQRVVKWLFVITNLLAIIMNLVDTVYFQYSGRRTTTSVFNQFANEDNLGYPHTNPCSTRRGSCGSS